MIKRLYCIAKISTHKGICKSLKLASRKSTKRLESFCENLEHMERVRWLKHTCAYYKKFFQEHPEYKSSPNYHPDQRYKLIIEDVEIESYFGPSPPEP